MDYRAALAWYMYHVWHCEGETYVREYNGMSCMPAEFKKAIQDVYHELKRPDYGFSKPDGSEG